MTRPLAALVTITGVLAAGLAFYRLSPFVYAPMDAIAPLVRLSIGTGALVIASLVLDRRRARQWRRRMDHLDAIGHALWRDRADQRRTGS